MLFNCLLNDLLKPYIQILVAAGIQLHNFLLSVDPIHYLIVLLRLFFCNFLFSSHFHHLFPFHFLLLRLLCDFACLDLQRLCVGPLLLFWCFFKSNLLPLFCELLISGHTWREPRFIFLDLFFKICLILERVKICFQRVKFPFTLDDLMHLNEFLCLLDFGIFFRVLIPFRIK